ncbi:OmpA family protein [Anianabacter salinae]|uniref:OmpA family protein n=1 Tax=Anianabacter salinae TaxID=2851023 RepID=UPI00225E1143|nr:OmpA family protein [Anianabacter salinae]MBV0914195.1 OmpA family protein [Anianabacter salinae]
MRAIVLAALIALPAAAQESEIFIPGQTTAPVIDAAPANALANCLANPSAATCTGAGAAPEGRTFENAGGGSDITFETLILDLNADTVTASPAPPPETPDYAAPVSTRATVALPSVAITIEFDFDSDRIRYDQTPKIASLIEAFRDPALASYAFAVIGHTDASGSDAYNCDLSRRRAASVTGTLLANYVEVSLTPVGFGEHVLKNTYDPNAPENRRVTFLRLPVDASAVLATAASVCGGY